MLKQFCEQEDVMFLRDFCFVYFSTIFYIKGGLPILQIPQFWLSILSVLFLYSVFFILVHKFFSSDELANFVQRCLLVHARFYQIIRMILNWHKI
jgi:hypothetical protein